MLIDIPSEDWESFCNDFSRLHEGWLIDVEVYGDGVSEKKCLANKLPLNGISSDYLAVGGDRAIYVTAGDETEDHVVHIVNDPSRLSLEQTENGDDAGLLIQSKDGTSTVVRFESPAKPDSVDLM